MDFEQVAIVKRRVKYPRLELKIGSPVLILPQNYTGNPILIINKHKKWLNQKLEFIKDIRNKYGNQRIYHRGEDKLIELIKKFIDRYSNVLHKKPKKIKFMYMKSRWGSCGENGRITFNLALKHLPNFLIRYVVFHEMVHMLVPNHKKEFWSYVSKEFKSYKQCEEKLFGYWFLLNQQKVNDPKIYLIEG